MHWLVYTGLDGEAVVASYDPFGFEEGWSDEEGDPADPPTTFDPQRHGVVCAESFSEFLYRFWIENELLIALNRRRARLTDERRRYADHYLR